MEILDFVQKHLNYGKRSVQIGIFLSYGLILALHFVLLKPPVNVLQLASELIFLAIIHLWVSTAPTFYTRIQTLKEAFSDPSYQALCGRHLELLEQFHYRTRGERLLKGAYFLLWMGILAYLLAVSFYFEINPRSVSGAVTTVLFVLALLLNYSSYYSCILLAFFLGRVSNLEEIDRLKHNRYLPSSTSGFQRLVSNATVSSITFLVVSILFTTEQVIASCFQTVDERVELHPRLFALMVMITCFMGLGTFLVLYLVPRYFLRKILRRWKEHSLLSLEQALDWAENQGDDSKIDWVLAKIEMLGRDNLKTPYSVLETGVALTTALLNILSIIVCLRQ